MSSQFEVVHVNLPFPVSANAKAAVHLWGEQSSLLKQCPAFPTSPAVQSAVADADAAAAQLQTTVGDIDQVRAKLRTLEKTRDVQLGALHIKHDAVETACTAASNNDPEAAKAWTGETKARAKPSPIPAGTGAPLDATLRTIKRHAGSVIARCQEEAGALGYVYQFGTDPNHPEAWPPAVYANGHTFTLRNQPIGQVLYARIAVVRHGSVQGAWSAILQVTVR